MPRAPLLFAPCHGGTAIPLIHVMAAIAPARRGVALTARGVDDGREPFSRVEAMAAAHVDEAIAARPEGPHRIVGWSFGALVAYEIGVQLRREGRDAAVVLLDPLALVEPADASPADDPAASVEQRRVLAAHGLARSRYRPGRFAGPIALLRAAVASPEAGATPALGWDRVVGGSLEVQRVAGDHRSMLTPPHAAELGAAILAFLDRLEDPT
ncbi:MAG: thioesterase domain-containing protein [Byssovorax sp.]